MAAAARTARKSSKLRKGLLTFLTIGAVGAVGAFASTALLSGDVELDGSIVAHGGTLDIEQTADGTFTINTASLQNMQPTRGTGASSYVIGKFKVKNVGSVPGKVTMITEGTDPYDCFDAYIATNPGGSALLGSGGGGTNPSELGTKVGGVAWTASIPAVWPAGMEQGFQVAIRMKNDCEQGSNLSSQGSESLDARHEDHATASLKVRFKIDQA